MNKWALVFLFLTATVKLSAQTNAPVRLAVVSESGEAVMAEDVLTAQLSSNEKIQLLERDQIEKVYREQGMSAANRDDLKLGRILGADGVLVLEVARTPQGSSLMVRLMAAKPGVVLENEHFRWPLTNLKEWSVSFAKHLELYLPKLTISAADAVPISVVNFRSALQSEEGREAERQLKLLAIQRLSQEPQLFVLERQKLQLLSGEKAFNADESPFWDGSYLLDGVVDQSGYSQKTITINARLAPPKGGIPLQFEVSGDRTNLPALVNLLAAKVTESLKLNSTVMGWNAADEAQQYLEEAKWAMRWDLYTEAQAAAETAWALGRQDVETAQLRICAYSQIVPMPTLPDGIFRREVFVSAVPDASQFKPLTRALELFCQDAQYVLGTTNHPDPKGCMIGLQLLRRAAGLLESYYYAAEMRVGNESQLSDFREKVRLTLSTLDACSSFSTDQQQPWNNLHQDYQWLQWEEGGICLEQPEDALPRYRQLLADGYHPEHLPRLIGWSWESRKRVPGLLRQFVNEVCADTNPVVRLQGLYLAVLEAPNDEAGTLQHRETKLVLALWENRRWLLSNAENASLVEYTRNALRSKFGYTAFAPNEYFSREPFASFQHRLRMDFLEHTPKRNRAVFWALFPNTSERMETTAQARELLPLAEQYEQKFHLTRASDTAVRRLRQVAGVAESSPARPAEAALPARKVLEAKFIKWNLRRPGIDPDRIPNFRAMIFRDGKLWLRVCYLSTNGPADAELQEGIPVLRMNLRTTYLAVDPQKGVEEEIPFPARLGIPADAFEVTTDSLFVNAQGHLYRFKFPKRTWDEIPAPMEDSSQLVWLKGNLFVTRSDGLLEVNPETKKVKVLVSSRRRPALNEIDPLWTAGTQIYPRSDGKFGALSEDHCFCFDPDTERWNIRTLPVGGTNNYFGLSTFFTSAGGAQILLTGAVAHRYLVGYWNDRRPPESLLMEPSPFKMKDSANERLLQPVQWDWPQGFPLEPSSVVAGDHELWILCLRKVWLFPWTPAEEPMKFSDDRQATLFCCEPEFRQAWSIPIHFEDSDQAVVFRRQINGRTVDWLSPAGGGFMGNWERLERHLGNAVFWVKTPEGLVFGAPNYCGHWLIPASVLEARRQTQRRTLDQPAQTPAPGSANPAKP